MPSNSVSNSDHQDDTFATIVEGGKVYGDRIAAWVKAKTEHDAAYAKLQLGRATKNMLTEAENTKAEAERVLADARKRADETVAEAMRKAGEIVSHGEDRKNAAIAAAEEAQRQAADARNSAAKYAADTTAAADKKLAEATRVHMDNNTKAIQLAAKERDLAVATQRTAESHASLRKKHDDLAKFLATQRG